MVVGDGAWVVPGAQRLGIPDWCVSDGPVGARGRSQGPGLVVPGPSAIAATWNVELVEEVGVALGTECNDRKVDVLLAPTVNLHRSPRGGRHFESYSEDPLLSSRICVAYIQGVQSRNVGACVKHFVANDQEFERFTINVAVDERALREIYLPPFEAAVTEANVRSVMGAYNFVNGVHACAHEDLLVNLLKGEWGFDGFVVSDWGAIKETVAPANFGLDLEMPGPGKFWGKGQLQAAVERGDVPEKAVTDKVERLVGFLEWAGRLNTPTDHEEHTVERPEHRELARLAAAESMVLLRNHGGLLPLPTDKTIALIGPGVADTALLGGGSASLVPHRTTTVLDAMTDRLGDRLVGTAPGVDMRRRAADVPADRIGEGGVTFDVFDGVGFHSEPFETINRPTPFSVWFGDNWPEGHDAISVRASFTYIAEHTGRHRLCALGFAHCQAFVDGALVADNEVAGFAAGLGQHGGDGYLDMVAGQSYQMVLEHSARDEAQWICLLNMGLELADSDPEAAIAEAEALAATADMAVVVVGSSSEWESEGADRESIDLPNGQDELVTRVLAANPNTVVVLNCGAPMTLPWLDDVPATLLAWYPGQEGGEAIADVLVGDAEPAGRMPTSWVRDESHTPSFANYPGENGLVTYGEGIFVGYRGYDANDINPMLPFGHGGSYTTFSWAEPTVSGTGTNLTVEVALTNTGDRGGSEVVQLYVAPHAAPVDRPKKELAGFAKLRLEPGATGTARIELNERSFARWCIETSAWVVDPGEYSLLISASAEQTHHVVPVTL